MTLNPPPLEPEELAARKTGFDHWLCKNGKRLGYFALPANQQEKVRVMLMQAFNGGTNYERRLNQPVCLGGYD